ncbi:hypothetical protein J3E69DRAFT_338097 [Trichoderma sp. SZMC 28015]
MSPKKRKTKTLNSLTSSVFPYPPKHPLPCHQTGLLTLLPAEPYKHHPHPPSLSPLVISYHIIFISFVFFVRFLWHYFFHAAYALCYAHYITLHVHGIYIA